MCNLPAQTDSAEMRQALDDLLQTFLVVSPRNADHPAVRRARDLVSRVPRPVQMASQHDGRAHAITETRPDIPESFVIGSD